MSLGSFGILDSEKLQRVANKLGGKYFRRVQQLVSEYKGDFSYKAKKKLGHIQRARGTLNPAKLRAISSSDKYDVNNIIKGFKLYGQEFKDYTLEEFDRLLTQVNKNEILPLSINYIFSGEKIGRPLRLKEKIECGLLESAIQIECSKLYLEREPALLAGISLDVPNELLS